MSTARALEAPRPLKSVIKQQTLPMFQQQQSYEVQSIEDLISLTETVAQSLYQGDVSFDLFNKMFTMLQLHGPQLEAYFKEVLDRCFNIFRNASQDDRLKIAIRLNLLNLIELRANSWVNKCADYYKSKANEPDNELLVLGSSPSLSGMAASNMMASSLQPGEIVKNSGKFVKPTKIPGKNYSKDEIIIRNSDSGKVNPGAKERLVQITGPNEESINYAKMLIEDTIKRNASPIRDASQEGSVSSLASSDDQVAAIRSRPILNSAGSMSMQAISNIVQQLPMGNKLTRSNSHHYFGQNQTNNDASVGEFKYTVNVGPHSLKISGDSLKLVQAAKLILDDFFTNEEFLKSTDAISTHADPMIPPQIPTQHVDSGVGLDILARCPSGANMLLTHTLEAGNDDEVFAHDPSPPLISENIILTSSSSIDSSGSSNTVTELQQSLGLCRSKRSHFSRKDSTPDNKNRVEALDSLSKQQRICYSVQSLWWFAKNLPQCKTPPSNIEKLRESVPFIMRDKQGDQSNLVRYCDVDKYMQLREKMDKRNLDLKCEDVIEIDDED